MAGAGGGDEVQISWRGGGWGGRSGPPPSSTPDPKVSSSCLLACLLASLLACQLAALQAFPKDEHGDLNQDSQEM